MLLIFPIVYIVSFLLSIWGIYKKKGEAAFIYVIFGLPIYNTAFSILYLYRLNEWIPLLQSLKELLILSTLLMLVWNHRKRFFIHSIDYWILAFLLYTSFYTIIPLGHFSIVQKLVALKALSFFTVIYFTGRFIDIEKIYIRQLFYWVGMVTIAAAALQIYEVITDTHFQIFSGYTLYNEEFNGTASSGHYGLSWTFERDNGVKRFASFFSNPLDLANSTLVTTAMILSMYTDKKNALRLNRFAWLVALSALIAVVFAISRASLAAYVLLIYFYALITRKKEIQYVIYSLLGASMFYLLFLMKDKNLIEYIVNTIQLNDSSSIGHLLEWVEGTQTIFTHPFGIGLGESGKVAAALQKNIGGENQFIIVGVQTGILSLFIYIAIYVLIIRNCWKYYPLLTGKAKMLALSLLLIKIAFIFPLFTSNFDSNSYIVFLTWLLTGIFISMIQNVKTVKI
jgi:hypothetical protein